MINEEILFHETQKFRQWWLWLIILCVNVMLIYGLFFQTSTDHTFGDNPMSDKGLWISAVTSLLVIVLFIFLKLETIITQEGVYVRFFPIMLRYKHYPWTRLASVYVRQYSPLGDFGGWGYRITIRNGKALNVSGNKGIQMILNDGSKILIGTLKPEEAETIIKKNSNK